MKVKLHHETYCFFLYWQQGMLWNHKETVLHPEAFHLEENEKEEKVLTTTYYKEGTNTLKPQILFNQFTQIHSKLDTK